MEIKDLKRRVKSQETKGELETDAWMAPGSLSPGPEVDDLKVLLEGAIPGIVASILININIPALPGMTKTNKSERRYN